MPVAVRFTLAVGFFECDRDLRLDVLPLHREIRRPPAARQTGSKEKMSPISQISTRDPFLPGRRLKSTWSRK